MNGSSMQQRLKSLLHIATERWSYAIFWDTTITLSSVRILNWGDGFHAGNNDEDRTKQFFDLSMAQFYDSAGNHLLTTAPAWFTAANENPCFRPRQALTFGIGTMVSFPLYCLVLELGSTDRIQPSTSDIHSKIFAVFSFDTAQLQLVNLSILVPEAEKLSHKRRTDLSVKREVARKRQKRLTDGFEALRAVIPNGSKKKLVLAAH